MLGTALLVLVALSAHAQDDDGDGLSNAQEAFYGTESLDPDSDGDAVPDGAEALVLAADLDGDGDRL